MKVNSKDVKQPIWMHKLIHNNGIAMISKLSTHALTYGNYHNVIAPVVI